MTKPNYSVDPATITGLHDEHMDAILGGWSGSCPTCEQHCEMYDRTISEQMTSALSNLLREYGQSWGKLSTILKRNGNKQADETKLAHWGLIEAPAVDEDRTILPDRKRKGVWRVTDRGLRWLLGNVTVPETLFIYNNKVVRSEGRLIGPTDTIGRRNKHERRRDIEAA